MKAMIPSLVGQRHRGTVTRESFRVLPTAAEEKTIKNCAFSPAHPKRSFHKYDIGSDRVQKLIEASEHMSQHIARELHDDIGQRLSLLSIKLGLLRQVRTFEDPDGNLAESLRDLDTLISDVHHLSHNLHSSRIEHLGLQAALEDVIVRFPEAFNIQIELVATKVPRILPPGYAVCFFRIAQESLSNAIKHSGTSRVRIELALNDGILTMIVQDFGSGFERNQPLEGLGLMSMAERMAGIGGTLTIKSKLGVGTIVTAAAQIPVAVVPWQSTVSVKNHQLGHAQDLWAGGMGPTAARSIDPVSCDSCSTLQSD